MASTLVVYGDEDCGYGTSLRNRRAMPTTWLSSLRESKDEAGPSTPESYPAEALSDA